MKTGCEKMKRVSGPGLGRFSEWSGYWPFKCLRCEAAALAQYRLQPPVALLITAAHTAAGPLQNSTPAIMSAPATEGPGASGMAGGNRKLQQTQAQVDEVVDIMRVNVDKVLERDQKLSELDDRADALQAGASQFETNAAKLKRKYWWKNCKMWAILIAVIIIIIAIIIIWNKS
ncbi:hypothetical protein MHYP_G00272910 [Metynnis hypsauchen]